MRKIITYLAKRKNNLVISGRLFIGSSLRNEKSIKYHFDTFFSYFGAISKTKKSTPCHH